jgi:hypothetical protein
VLLRKLWKTCRLRRDAATGEAFLNALRGKKVLSASAPMRAVGNCFSGMPERDRFENIERKSSNDGEMTMRKLILAGVALFVVTAAPGFARDYAWCARTPANGGNPQCDYTSFRQCQATISGQGGDCIRDPGFAYGRMGNRWPTGANWGGWENRW